ncbi:L,D-transpeptidase [Gemmatimonadota bacterium]
MRMPRLVPGYFPALFIAWSIAGSGSTFAQNSPPQTPDEQMVARIELLGARIRSYIDSLHVAGAEMVFTQGQGGNAPQDAIEKMNRVLDGTFRNPEAHRISSAVQSWGRGIRWEFRDLGEPLITRIIVYKYAHTARLYHGETLLFETPVAVGNPEISKETPEGTYNVLYVDFKPVSRWIRGSVPYGHEYNPYGSRQIPFYKDWTMHGNNDPAALGKDISKGCVRFHNSEILVIAEFVKAVHTGVEVRP